MLRWTFLLVILLFLFTGCGDLEPDMQDTRTVILNMDFHGKSSSRSSSSVSASELSQYNTHLILALPSWEYLTSSYRNYYSSFAQGLMNTADKKVSLEIPLNTQMKIFAFLFKENYSMSELFSGVREVGYYGESRSFSINTNTNSLSLGITLKAASGNEDDSTGTGAGTGDTTAPTASVTTATITTSENAVVQSTETGTAYLVNTAVTVSNLASITGAADNQSNSVTISSAATNTNLPATGLADGTYKVFAVDAAGNLSSASSNSVTLLIDYALDFDGTNDNVSANGAAVTLNTSNNNNSLPLSVSAWVYPDNGTKDQLIFGLYKNSTFINGPSVWFGDNDYYFNYYDKINTSSIYSSTTYAINNWHHVVLTIRDNRSGVLYVNGSSALTISGANGEGGLDMFSIGVDYDSSSGSAGNPTKYFDGKIDEVAVWNDELTSAEVTAIYNSGNMLNVSSNSGNYASAVNLQGYYRFNEGSGTSLQDNSSNSNTGTITGAIWTAGFVSK